MIDASFTDRPARSGTLTSRARTATRTAKTPRQKRRGQARPASTKNLPAPQTRDLETMRSPNGRQDCAGCRVRGARVGPGAEGTGVSPRRVQDRAEERFEAVAAGARDELAASSDSERRRRCPQSVGVAPARAGIRRARPGRPPRPPRSLRARSNRWRRRGVPRRDRGRGFREHPALLRRPRGRCRLGAAASGCPTRGAACPGPCRAHRRARGRRPARTATPGSGRAATSDTPRAVRVSSIRAAAPACRARRPATSWPSPSSASASARVFPPGAAHASSTRRRARADQQRHRLRRLVLKHEVARRRPAACAAGCLR